MSRCDGGPGGLSHAHGVAAPRPDRRGRHPQDRPQRAQSPRLGDLGELIDRGAALHFAHESIELSSRSGRLSVDILAAVAAVAADCNVPNLFLIDAPVFRQGTVYRLAVKLRYRVKEGSIFWRYTIDRKEKALEDAFNTVVDVVTSETAFPVFHGAPERPISDSAS